jgi:hypothetical protein
MQLAHSVKDALKKDFEQQKKYYDYMKAERLELFADFDGQDGEAARNEYFLRLFGELVNKYEPDAAKQPTEGPVNITNPKGADSLNKIDTGKKDK